MKVYRSETLTTYTNLQLEEGLFHLQAGMPSLLFWRSRPAVVIGKNQNPWNECNLRYCAEHNIDVARRITGGGAVYHDEGNLNYALCLSRGRYDMDSLLDAVCSAFTSARIPVHRFQANGLGVDQRKFSGHAFCYRQDKVLHHGTCLIHSDLRKLEQSLRIRKTLSTHAVDSCRSVTLNLSDVVPGLNAVTVEDIFIQAVSAYSGCAVTTEADIRELPLDTAILSTQDTDEWTYLKTPTFRLPTSAGNLQIRRGKIEVTDEKEMTGILGLLHDCEFTRESVTRRLEPSGAEDASRILRDLDPYWCRP